MEHLMEGSLITIALICLAGVLVFMMIGIPLPFAIGASAVIGAYLGWGSPGLGKMGLIIYQQFFHLQWTPLALFVFLACIIDQTSIGSQIFIAANKWLSRLPAGLIVASIGAEAGMAAAIGSSTTTALAVGKVAVPQMVKLGYNKSFAVGALLCGGALGCLIPPSIPFIVYANMARQSIGELFMAGILPGILLALMLALTAIIITLVRPQMATRPPSVTWKERLVSIRSIWSIILLMLFILGGIYLGIMTANEAAGVGCVFILIIAILFYKFRLKNLINAMKEAALFSGMITFMIISVMALTYVVATSGMAQIFADYLVSSGLSRWGIIIMIMVVLLILGCFVDALTIVLITLPFLVPLVNGLGFNLVWFGVLLVINTEIGVITPPMGLNLFIMRGIFDIPIGDLVKGSAPFIGSMILFLVIIVAFPQIATWLPGMMKG
jgi:C4-dicarboxylate transporter, DctM subunit